MNRLKTFALIFGVTLLCFGCTVTPEETYKTTLSAIQNSVDVPDELEIINEHGSNSIYLSWAPVKGATYYKVEYQTVVDYISGKDMNFDYTIYPEYRLEIPESAKNDKRYLFRVTSGFKNSNGVNVESGTTDLYEGAVVNSLTVSAVPLNNNLTFYPSYEKINSILNKKSNIVEPVVEYYDGNFMELELDDDMKLVNGSIDIGSAEDRDFTAALFIDGSLITKTLVNVKTDVDYQPRNLVSLDCESNLEEGVKLSWVSYGLNKGLNTETTSEDQSFELYFRINRKKTTDYSYSCIAEFKASSLSDSYHDNSAMEETCMLPTYQFTYTDASAEPHIDYDYQVVSSYVCPSFKIDEDINGVRSVKSVHVSDRNVSSFITSGLYEDAQNGIREVNVGLAWSVYHELPDNYRFVISRINTFGDSTAVADDSSYIQVDNQSRSFVVGRDERSFTDTVSMKLTDVKAYQFQYSISLWKVSDEGELSALSDSGIIARTEEGSQALVTLSNNFNINFLKNDSLSVTGSGMEDGEKPMAGKIALNWEYNDSLDVELEDGQLFQINKDLLSVEICRANENGHFIKISEVPYGKNSFIDMNLGDGETYTYRINPVYKDEESDFFGQYPALSPVDGRTLSALGSFDAEDNKSPDRISISWSNVEGASGYRLYYKEKGTNLEKHTDLEEYMTEVIFDSSFESDLFGKTYEFSIAVIDENGDETSRSRKEEARTFSGANVSVTNSSDFVKLTWDPVFGATSYQINVYPSAESQDAIIEATVFDGSELKYTLFYSSQDLKNYALTKGTENSPFPYLSKEYYFSVTPLFGSEKPHSSLVKRQSGKWILPPTNIIADKAMYKDLVYLSWTAVEGADGYVLYRRQNEEAPWEEFDYVISTSSPGQTQKYRLFNPASEYYYSVASSDENGIVGPIQNAFDTVGNQKTNYGYALMQPGKTSVTDLGNGFAAVSFEKVLGADNYIIEIGERASNSMKTYKFPVSQIEASSFDGNYKDGAISNVGKRVTVYVSIPSITNNLFLNSSIYSNNSKGYYGENTNSSSANALTMYSNIQPKDILNVFMYCFDELVCEADVNFKNDWWPGITPSYYPAVYESYQFRTAGKTDGSQSSYLKLNNYFYNGLTLSSSELTFATPTGGAAGYLGTDKIYTISKGTLVISPAYGLNQITITFNNFNFYNLSGSVTVTGLIDQNGNPINATITEFSGIHAARYF